ncbi:MAG: hypothetical protein ACTSY1_11190 [Alphaproteobacteria bacterium]
MYRVDLPHALHLIAEKGFVDCDDVAQLRLQVFPQGVVSPDEAQALFWLNECTSAGVPEWSEFFASVLSDHFVHQQWPQGYIDDAGVDRLATCILRDGRIAEAKELELLVSIIENSSATPEQLVLFVLGEVRATVFTGMGPTRKGEALDPGVITQGEITLVERVIYGLAAQGCPAVSRAGAEILFDLNRKIAGVITPPGAEIPREWSKLFVNAIAGYVLAGRAWQAPKATGAAPTADCAVARITPETEAGWLVNRLGHDGPICANERDLLAYIGREADQIHPALEALIAQAA